MLGCIRSKPPARLHAWGAILVEYLGNAVICDAWIACTSTNRFKSYYLFRYLVPLVGQMCLELILVELRGGAVTCDASHMTDLRADSYQLSLLTLYRL